MADPNLELGATRYDNRITVLSVLGGPGSGKGTQSAALAETINSLSKKHNAIHISIGEMMRDEMNSKDSPFADRIRESQMTGQLGDPTITNGILDAHIRKAVSEGYNTFVLDGKSRGSRGYYLRANGVLMNVLTGYPRNLDRLQFFQNSVHYIRVTIYLKCSEAVLMQRLCGRGRADDNTEAVRMRIDTFNRETIPVVEELRLGKAQKGTSISVAENPCFCEVDAEARPDDVKAKVTEAVIKALNLDGM